MDFSFSEEQQMIRDTAAAFLAEVSDSTAVRTAMGSPDAGHGATWSRIVDEMGWQALTIPEACGGLALGQLELAIVLEQAGARLLCAPLLASVGLAGNALLACGDEAQLAARLPSLAAGEETLALALQAPGRSWGATMAGVRYRTDGAGYRLTGEVAYAVDGATADRLIVLAAGDDPSAPGQLRLFLVDGASPGLSRRAVSTLDQTRRLATLNFDNVAVPAEGLLVHSESGWPAIEPALDLGVIALAAELLGAAQQSLDLAVAYTLERKQFGRVVAGFQALKHKAADMMLRNECARSALYYAACVADGWFAGRNSAAELAEAASIAKASCGDAAFRNAGEALQMHGGNGFTWEYDVHLYFKRARAGRALAGTSEWHRERIATQLLGPAGEAEDAA